MVPASGGAYDGAQGCFETERIAECGELPMHCIYPPRRFPPTAIDEDHILLKSRIT